MSHEKPRGGGVRRQHRSGNESVPEPVRAVVRHLVARVIAIATADVTVRYDLGRMVHTLRYGSSTRRTTPSIAVLARLLDMHRTRLDRYARTAATIPPGEFAELVQLRTPRGFPLTWSHFELLARIRGAGARRTMAKAAADSALSVHALAKQVPDKRR
jgi:hypothetical protein